MFRKYRNLMIAGTLALVLIAVFFVIRNKDSNTSEWQTVPFERGRLAATIGATGTVRAQQTALLSWQTSGRIESVLVNIGDQVSAGDLLARLAEESLSQNIILATADLVNAQRNLDNLLTSNVAQAQARQALAKAQSDYDKVQPDYDNTVYVRGTEESIENARQDLERAETELAEKQKAYELVKDLPNGDSSKNDAKYKLDAAVENRDQYLSRVNYLDGKPYSQYSTDLAASYFLAEAKLADAKREWDRLKDGPDAADIAAAEARVTAIQSTLSLARVAAPFSGIVTQSAGSVGDLVNPGTKAFRVDNLSSFLVDVSVTEVDINTIAIGQEVTLFFDAILGVEYTGRVSAIEQAGSVNQGAVDFLVTVELQNTDGKIRPGMTAAVTILVMELENVLLVPNRAVRFVDGNRVVYVLRDGQPEQVKITLGASSDSVSEVLNPDIKEGDLIILNPPSSFGPQGGGPFGR